MTAAFERVARFPHLASTRDDLFPSSRELPVERHVVLYADIADSVRVIRVLHARMDALANSTKT